MNGISTSQQVATAIHLLLDQGVAHDCWQTTPIADRYGPLPIKLSTGSLGSVIRCYEKHAEAKLGDFFNGFARRLQARDPSLVEDIVFCTALKVAASDAALRLCYQLTTRHLFWQPTVESAARAGIRSELGHAIVFDSVLRGCWFAIMTKVVELEGLPAATGERQWLESYLKQLRIYLVDCSNVSRNRALRIVSGYSQLLFDRRWALALPVEIAGERIDAISLRRPPIDL